MTPISEHVIRGSKINVMAQGTIHEAESRLCRKQGPEWQTKRSLWYTRVIKKKKSNNWTKMRAIQALQTRHASGESVTKGKQVNK